MTPELLKLINKSKLNDKVAIIKKANIENYKDYIVGTVSKKTERTITISFKYRCDMIINIDTITSFHII